MKNYKVKITRNFKDLVENVERVLGTPEAEFCCDEERYQFLLSKGAVELIEIVKPKKRYYKRKKKEE